MKKYFYILHNQYIVPLIASVGIAFALIAQYLLNMLPCSWCVIQRLICVIILCISLIPFNKLFKNYIYLLFSLFGFIVALYQFLIASHSNSCGISIAQKFLNMLRIENFSDFIFGVKALCSESTLIMNLIPFEIVSAIGFTLMSIICIGKIIWKK